MGEIADAMLDGTLCAGCGEYMGSDAGFAQYCSKDCEPDGYGDDVDMFPKTRKQLRAKIPCPQCSKKVRPFGLDHHIRDVHGAELRKRAYPKIIQALELAETYLGYLAEAKAPNLETDKFLGANIVEAHAVIKSALAEVKALS